MNEEEKDKKDEMKRMGANLQKELDEIKEENKKIFSRNKIPSNGKITNMIPKHNSWPIMKKDLINHDYNKKKEKKNE